MAKKTEINLKEILEMPSVRTMNYEEIKKTLPHRYPFLLIDKVEIKEERKYAVGIKAVTGGEIFFQGHFPQKAVFPGVLVLEAMGQVSGAMFLGFEEYKNVVPVFMSVESAKFRKTIVPGDVLKIAVNVLKINARIGSAEFACFVNGDTSVEAKMNFFLVPKEKI